MKEKKNRKTMTLKEKIFDNINVILSAYAIAFVIRLFLIEAYQIPSQSMVPSLLVGDILMVEKITAGPRIPVVNLKVPGLLKPKRNDVIVFISPAWKDPGVAKQIISMLSLYIINLDNTPENAKNLVKRLVGLPGDRIMMTNKILVINGEALPLNYITKKSERFISDMHYRGQVDFELFEESYGGKKRVVQYVYDFVRSSPVIWGTDNYFYLARTNKSAVMPTNDAARVSFLKLMDCIDRSQPLKYALGHELYEFPEIQVPQKGVSIPLTNRNPYYLSLIKLLIERESGKMVSLNQNKLYLEGKLLTEWNPREDYYFGMGDNRDMSQDCRYFGFIPASNIFGRPLFRYWPIPRFGFDVNENARSVSNRIY